MKFGYFSQLQSPKPWRENEEVLLYKEAMEQAVFAESVGFDYYWQTEHHFYTEIGHSSAPELFLAALAQHTTKIRLGPAVVVLPCNHPYRVVEYISTLDILSDGRVEFGTGRGASAYHIEAFGVSPDECWVPKALADKPIYVFETGGTTGVPKTRINIDDFRIDYSEFSKTLPDEFFPKGSDWLQLGPSTLRPLETGDGGYADQDAAGYQFLVDYASAQRGFDTFSLSDLLAGRVAEERIRQHVVVVGSNAQSLPDFFPIPGRGRVPGMELHGYLIDQLLRLGLGGPSALHGTSENPPTCLDSGIIPQGKVDG